MVPSIKLLEDRSVAVGDCLIWQQAANKNGTPIISLSKKQRSRSVRRIAYSLYHGHVPQGLFVFAKCGDARCISRTCLRCGSKGDYMRNAAQRGVYSRPDICAARAAAARARSGMTMADARAIRAERAAGRLLREIAAERGISMDMVSKIARHKLWREHAPNSSVFNLAA